MKIYPLPYGINSTDAVILANGQFPCHDIPLSVLEQNSYLICCDGAINELSDMNIVPQAIVGDCDSLSADNKRKYQKIIHQVNEQETNDLTKSVKYCIENGKTNITILGATGKREDHTIANISLLSEYIDLLDDICMISDYGIFNVIKESSTFATKAGQQISLFNITPTPITSIGLKYPIKNQIFTNWWQATLNEALTDSFTLYVDAKVIVFRAFS